MLRKSFAFILFVLIGAGINSAQTPEPKVEADKDLKSFAWTFDSDGGYLGVQAEDITKGNLAKFALREVKGVGIEHVVEGSPAEAAGLQKGDVILKVNGDDITSTRKLNRLINEISPDHQAKLTILRGGSEREITVTVGKRQGFSFGNGAFGGVIAPMEKFDFPPMPDMPNLERLPRLEGRLLSPDAPDAPVFFGLGNRRQLGLSTTPLTKQLADHFGVTGGALVTNVRENSAAAKAGIKAGDIITEADGKPLKGDFDLIRAVGEKKEGSIVLTVVRDKNRQTISVTPEEVKGDGNQFFEFSTPDAPPAPDTPTPGVFRMARPAVPMTLPIAPMPLNNLRVPGRIII